MNVIISGANGFLGRNLIEYLKNSDCFIYAVVKERTDAFDDIPNVRVLEFAETYADLAQQIDKQVDCFFHLAWTGTSGVQRNNEYIQINNVKESCDALNFASKLNVKRFIFFGSIMEFDIFNINPLDISPQNTTLYSLSKYAAHYFSRIIAERNKIEFITAIISNIYGPGEISKRFVYVMLSKMLNDETINLSSCQQPYDFIYITDAIRQIVAVAENGKNNELYYIGNSQQKRLRHYVEIMKEITGTKAELVFSPDTSKVFDDYYSKFETDKIEKDLHITPRVSFEEGITKTMEWIKNNG